MDDRYFVRPRSSAAVHALKLIRQTRDAARTAGGLRVRWQGQHHHHRPKKTCQSVQRHSGPEIRRDSLIASARPSFLFKSCTSERSSPGPMPASFNHSSKKKLACSNSPKEDAARQKLRSLLMDRLHAMPSPAPAGFPKWTVTQKEVPAQILKKFQNSAESKGDPITLLVCISLSLFMALALSLKTKP